MSNKRSIRAILFCEPECSLVVPSSRVVAVFEEEMPIVASGVNQDAPECSNAAVISDLDPQVWHKLPHELLEKVHLCLPLRSLARFRSVCTAWNDIVFDEGFIRARRKIVAQKPWIVITSTANSISVYDSGICPKPLLFNLLHS